MKLLNFGSLNIDFIYHVDHFVQAGETLSTHRTELAVGGKGLNQSVAAARAGSDVYHAGCVGEDGGQLLDYLRESGVNTDHVLPVPGRNGHALIQLDHSGQNSILLYGGSNLCLTKEQIDKTLADFAPGDVLMLQNEVNHLGYLVDQGAALGMKVCLNPSPVNAALDDVDFGKLYFIILNEVEGEQITGEKRPEDILAVFRQRWPACKVLLTLGGDGALFDDGTTRCQQPIFSVQVADTTGAGDTFTGYFLSEHLSGAQPADALRTATAASAVAVSRIGAAPSIPLRQEVEAFLAQHSDRP